MQRNAVKIRPALRIGMIADNQRNFAGKFPGVVTIEQVGETMIVFRNEDRDFGTGGGECHAPLHAEARCQRLEMAGEVVHVDRKSREVPFDPHEKKILLQVSGAHPRGEYFRWRDK